MATRNISTKLAIAPEGVLGYLKVLMVQGTKKYRAFVYPRARAALGNDNAQTRGSSITFQTAQTTFTIFADESSGDWRYTKECATEAEAKAFIDEWCGTDSTADATLAALTVGTLSLTPSFDPDVTEYAATATAASNAVTAVANDSDSTIAITNGEDTVVNGGTAAWSDGDNTITIVVTNGTATKTYTVTVSYSA